MKNKPKYIANSKQEFDYLEMAYKEFIKNYELEFEGGELLVEKGPENNIIKIVLEERYGKNNLIVKNKNLEKKVVATIVPYHQLGYPVFKVKDKKYWLEHRALEAEITKRYDLPRFFPRGDSGIKNGGYTR